MSLRISKSGRTFLEKISRDFFGVKFQFRVNIYMATPFCICYPPSRWTAQQAGRGSPWTLWRRVTEHVRLGDECQERLGAHGVCRIEMQATPKCETWRLFSIVTREMLRRGASCLARTGRLSTWQHISNHLQTSVSKLDTNISEIGPEHHNKKIYSKPLTRKNAFFYLYVFQI